MLIYTSAKGALVRLVCPHCGKAQVRGRKSDEQRYACRRCRKRFTREQGEEAARPRR